MYVYVCVSVCICACVCVCVCVCVCACTCVCVCMCVYQIYMMGTPGILRMRRFRSTSHVAYSEGIESEFTRCKIDGPTARYGVAE
jgi:hypothetical protein